MLTVTIDTRVTSLPESNPSANADHTGNRCTNERESKDWGRILSEFAASKSFEGADLGNCMRVLQYITQPSLRLESVMEFEGVGIEDYLLISQFVNDIAPVRPRLSYYHHNNILIVEMRSTIHEEPFNNLAAILRNIGVTGNVMLRFNYPIFGESGSFIPDLVMVLSKPATGRLYPMIGECAFAESKPYVIDKLKKEIEAKPGVIMVIMVVIKEVSPYRAPSSESPAAEISKDSGPILDEEKFYECSVSNNQVCSLSNPIIVHDHNWGHIGSVDYYVWFRELDGPPIDLDDRGSTHMGHGTLFPELKMDPFDAILNKGLSKINDLFIQYCREIDDTIDASQLCWHLPVTINWNQCVDDLISAHMATAYGRYYDYSWMSPLFQGMERPHTDSSVAEPENAQAPEAPSGLSATSSVANKANSGNKTRRRKKRASRRS